MESDYRTTSISSYSKLCTDSENTDTRADKALAVFRQSVNRDNSIEEQEPKKVKAKKGLSGAFRKVANRVSKSSEALFTKIGDKLPIPKSMRRSPYLYEASASELEAILLAQELIEYSDIPFDSEEFHLILDERLTGQDENQFTKALISTLILNNPDRAFEYIRGRMAYEVRNANGNQETLLRHDSLFSKAMAEVYKHYANEFRESVVDAIMQYIQEEGSVEVDPARISDENSEEALCADQEKLLRYVEYLFTTVDENLSTLPEEIKNLLNDLSEIVSEEFDDSEVVSQQLGTQIFLRCLIPAITTPHVYLEEYRNSPPSTEERRTLVLIGKIAQNTANRTEHGMKQKFLKFANAKRDDYELATRDIVEKSTYTLPTGITIARKGAREQVKIHPLKLSESLGRKKLSNDEYQLVFESVDHNLKRLIRMNKKGDARLSPKAFLILYGNVSVLSKHMTKNQKTKLLNQFHKRLTEEKISSLQKGFWESDLIEVNSPTDAFSREEINPRDAIGIDPLMEFNVFANRNNNGFELLDILCKEYLGVSL